jgi:hypothetical protein
MDFKVVGARESATAAHVIPRSLSHKGPSDWNGKQSEALNHTYGGHARDSPPIKAG